MVNSALSSHIPKYLLKYAEPSSHTWAKQLGKQLKDQLDFDNVLIIPAFNESTAFLRRLIQTHFAGMNDTLVLVIVNQPEGQSILRKNQRLLDFITECSTPANLTFCAVNACEPGLPKKGGVGSARKLGCDIALHLMAGGLIKPTWLRCTDADAHLPQNYFLTPPLSQNVSALCFNFHHLYEQTRLSWAQRQLEAINRDYEMSLRYYRAGLVYANSPYAHFALGSCMALNPAHYGMVRGIPKRSAGEDFYVLNKLAKTAPILSLNITLGLTPRASTRVPFGTGPAIQKRLKDARITDYNPHVFEMLKLWIQQLDTLSQTFEVTKGVSLDQLMAGLPAQLKPVLECLAVNTLVEHINKQGKKIEQVATMCHHWFDAFKTLKLIHALSDSLYPRVPQQSLKNDPPPWFTPQR